MGNCRGADNLGALCHALEPRLLLAANPVDSGAGRISAALSAISAEFATFKASGKSGAFHASNPLVHIDDKRIAVELAAEDPAALKIALTALRIRRASIAGHLLSGLLPLGQ